MKIFSKYFEERKLRKVAKEEQKQFKEIREAVSNFKVVEVNRCISISKTPYDRQRKITPEKRGEMRDLYLKNYTISEIAKIFNVSYYCVKYNLDEDYRNKVNKDRVKYGWYTKSSNVSERSDYKKALINDDDKLRYLLKEGRIHVE